MAKIECLRLWQSVPTLESLSWSILSELHDIEVIFGKLFQVCIVLLIRASCWIGTR